MVSSNGVSWNIGTSAADNDWNSVIYGTPNSAGLFVAVASSGLGNCVMTSPNGIIWTIRSSAIDNNWKSVIYGTPNDNGLYVAVSSSGIGNRVMTSSDGINWSIRASAADNDWNSVTYGNGLFVAVSSSGSGNRVMTSPDGINWTIRNSAVDNNWTSITYGKGIFVAVASSGINNRVMTSPDGINWTIRKPAADNDWNSITYGNDIFVAVSSSGTGNRIMTSFDGISWTIGLSDYNYSWKSVTYGYSYFVSVSDSGFFRSMVASTTPPTLSNFYYNASDGTNKIVKKYGDSNFNLINPISNSNGNFTFTSSNSNVATITNLTTFIVGAGQTVITAKQKPTNYYTSGTITCDLIVNKINPTLYNFDDISVTYGTSPFTVIDPSSNSNGAFSYEISNSSCVTITGNIITIIGAGFSTITAIQSETSNYNSSIITRFITVAKANTTLSNFNPNGILKTYGDGSFNLVDPSSNSNGQFTYVSSIDYFASITGNTVTINSGGTCTITAIQAETLNYNSNRIICTLTIQPTTPTITNFNNISLTYLGNDYKITKPTSNSSGTFSYTSSNNSVATVYSNSGNYYIKIISAGSSTITATQGGTTNYKSGTISCILTVNKANPSLTLFNDILTSYKNEPLYINSPYSNSDGSFNFSSSNLSVATIEGNYITTVSAGYSTITATQSETTNFNSGTITCVLTVSKTIPTLSNFFNITTSYGNNVNISDPLSNSNGLFSYSSSNTNIATISGNIIRSVGIGNSIITATQSETLNYSSKTITCILTVGKANPTLSNFPNITQTYGISEFDITTQPNSNSDGIFNYTSSNNNVAAIYGHTIYVFNAGITTITAIQNYTSNFNSGTITCTLTIEKAEHNLSNFPNISNTYGNQPFYIDRPSSNSDGIISYSSSNPLVATISDDIIIMTGAGSAIITATQSESQNYKSKSITCTLNVGKATPILSNFNNLNVGYSNILYDILNPYSNSPGSFSFTSSNASVATISGNKLTTINFGTTTITATQNETSNFTSNTITSTLTVFKSSPTIIFPDINKKINDIPFILQPSSNSTGTFSFTSSNTSVATVSGNKLTIVGLGITVISVTQTETTYYNSGSSFCNLNVSKIIPSLSNFLSFEKGYSNIPFTINSPSSNSMGSFSFSSSNTSVATISGNKVKTTGLGTTTITATQSETPNFSTNSISCTLTVVKSNPTIIFPDIIKGYSNGPFTLNPSSNSTGLFSFINSDDSVITINGNTVTILGLGTTTITATQSETTYYNSLSVTCTLTVSMIIFPVLSDFPNISKIYGSAPFIVTNPTSESPGAFTYTSSDESVATISNNVVTIIGKGSTTITATQEPTSNYGMSSIMCELNIEESSPTNPVTIENIPGAINYFMESTSTYASLSTNLQVINNLQSTTEKILTNNSEYPTLITKQS